MDEDMQMAAMEAMMGGGMGAGAMAGDPFSMDAPPGYTSVLVPDAVLPAVMELVNQAETSGSAMGASAMTPGAATMGGAPLL